jgi:hypothetical protein
MSRNEATATQVERWTAVANIVAPTTLLGAMLFYFGYVSSQAEYAYFGLDVGTIGLSTQEYIMRSPQPLLVPLLMLPLAGTALLLADAAVRRRIAPAGIDTADQAKAAKAFKRISRGSAVGALAALFAGIVLLFIYSHIRDWPFYGLVTPIVLASGAGLAAYSSHLRRTTKIAAHRTRAADAELSPMDRLRSLPPAAAMLIYAVIIASIFWATATIAQWSGLGLAQSQAQHLDRLPSVILDTRERLYLRDPGIEETVLRASQWQTFHYRYRHLRLLIQGNDRMFLVPDFWSASDSTLIVPMDGSVRVQFQFQNASP